MNPITKTAVNHEKRLPYQQGRAEASYTISLKPADAPKTVHSHADGRPDKTQEQQAYKQVNEFCDANPEATAPRMRCIADPETDPKTVEETLTVSNEATRTLLKGLTALGQLHPFVAMAVGAFALVITMDLTRRDNDRKVMSVKAQMQDLMSALFELRRVETPNHVGPDGVTISQRLSSLMKEISDDIKACGSACDTYLKKGFLAKTVKSGKYETRLADYGDKFIEYRKRLKMALSVHTAIAIDKANQQLEGQDQRLQVIEEKLDMLLLFQKLETPREKEVKRFINEHGGAKACIDNDELLEELIARSGEGSSRIGGKDGGRKANDLPEVRKRLRKELQEDIDEAFSRNMVLFERKLDIQSKQLTEAMQEESEHIINTLLAGAHDRIIDPDLQKIWKDMGWKGSVKARHFVLALHDYYTDRLNEADSPSTPRTPLPSPGNTQRRSVPVPRKKQDDKWALAYINAAYVQPILEAVDDDGTGFVSVKEVNTFVSERPEGWSLPHWIAYWAVGWQASMSRYKNKIYELVQRMFQVLKHALPSNRRAVDEYLFHASFWRIELLLRSTRSVNPQIYSDPDLIRITEAYTKSEEERLDLNLQSVGYELDTPATVSLVTGVGRIERYVFPLIYLLLRRHLKVMSIACKHVVDTEEFVTLNDSLVSILVAIDYRIQSLEAIFKQTHLDVQARLGNFAFGIFQLSYGDIRRIPINNTFGTWVNDEDAAKTSAGELTLEEIKRDVAKISLDILKYGIKDGFQSTDYFEFEEHHLKKFNNPIQGTWTGHCQKQGSEDSYNHVIRISIRILPDLCTMLGKGEDYAETFEFEGQVRPVLTGWDFSFEIISDENGPPRTCYGTLHTATDVIYAHWRTTKKTESGDSIPDQAFELRRTPPSLVRYRYTSDQFAEDPVRSRWSFACAATLHQAQERLWSRRFFEARFTERKRFVELTTRALIVDMALTPQNPLNMAETRELEYLRQELNPSEARFYQALAEFEIQKLPWHPSWGCDWCERRITKCRILCVQCMTDDLSDNIDLCAVCIDRTPSKRGFSHENSHTVVKVEQTLHDYEFSKIVDSARVIAERVKGIFRSMDSLLVQGEVADNSNVEGQDGMPSVPLCVCCQRKVTPPCWVCCVCSRDTFVCQECDSKRIEPPATSTHTLAHALVRIRDSLLSGESTSIEERMLLLEHRVVALEHRITEGLSSLEAKYENSIAAIEARIDERMSVLEKSVEDKFASLEDVLRQIAAQTAALPAVYGQVVRDFYVKSPTIREG